jgi:hypothetical protein
MALLWIEGFEGFGTSVDSLLASSGDVLARKYANLFGGFSALYLRAGRLSGYSVQGTYNTASALRTPVLPTTADTLIVGVGFKPHASNSAEIRLLRLSGPSGAGVYINHLPSSNEITAYSAAGSLLGTSTGANVTSAAWSYIELKVKYASAGTIEVRVGGTTVLSLTGVDTRIGGAGSYNNQVGWSFSATGEYPPFFDDLYVCDNSGSLHNNFLGDCKVIAAFPTSDASPNDWTVSAGSNHYALVDENPANDDTDHLESTTSAQKELWGHGALSATGAIFGVMVNTDARMTSGSSSLKMPCKSGATETDDTAQTVTSTSFVTFTRVLETDPHTGAGWTLANLNAAQFGIKVG